MRKKTIRVLTMLLMLMLLSAAPAQAKANYKKIYASFLASREKNKSLKLSGGTYYTRIKNFYLLNLDTDKIPELVVSYASYRGPGINYYVYTIKNGKVKYCGNKVSRNYFDQVAYNKKKKALYISDWINGVGGVVFKNYRVIGYKLKKSRQATRYAKSRGSSSYVYQFTTTAYGKLVTVSKSTYYKYVNQYFPQNKIKVYNMHSNTKSVRKRVLGY